MPSWARLAKEVRRRRDEYDVIVTWSERVSLSLMALDRFSPGGKPHVALLYWFSRPAVQLPIRALGNGFHAIVTWTSVQRNYAITHLGIAPAKLYLVRHFVDQLFWSPRPRETDMICSVGAERDYGTLLEPKSMFATGVNEGGLQLAQHGLSQPYSNGVSARHAESPV